VEKRTEINRKKDRGKLWSLSEESRRRSRKEEKVKRNEAG
jgi:hypothetical protein